MFGSLFLAAALTFTPADAQLAYDMAQQFVSNCTPRNAGTIRGNLAANWILDKGSSLGLDIRRDPFTADTPDGPAHFVNLYSEIKSNPTSRYVVVLSHFDTKHNVVCPGANDGAATTALLIALACKVADAQERSGNVLFAWCDGEECRRRYEPNDGLQGSRRLLQRLKASDKTIQAVLCLDMLGDRDLNISIPANGTPSLARIALHAARRCALGKKVTRTPLLVTDDHVPFFEAKIPAIDLIDCDYGPDNAWWHTPDDTMDKVSVESLLSSGRLVAELITLLS